MARLIGRCSDGMRLFPARGLATRCAYERNSKGLAIYILGLIFQWWKYFLATGAQQINSFQDLRYRLDGVNSTLCKLHKFR
jgi:hypothetical protein